MQKLHMAGPVNKYIWTHIIIYVFFSENNKDYYNLTF